MSATAATAWRARPGEWWLIGGVAAGLSERLAVPVGFIRGLLFAASVAQPAVIYAYMAAALLVPHPGHRGPSWANAIALARVALAFGLLWSVSAGGLSLTQGLFDQGPGVWVTQCGVCLAGIAALFATGVPAGERDCVADRRAVLAAGPLVVGTVLLGLGVLIVPGIAWERWLAGLAAGGGVGVLVGVGRGRAWGAGLIAPAAVLAAVSVMLATAGVRLSGGVGNRRVAVASVAAVAPSWRRAVGDLTIDLRALRASPGSAPVDVRATVGIGDLLVVTPASAQVSAVERVGRGQISRLAAPHWGFDLRRTVVAPAEDQRTGRPVAQPGLRLRIAATVGIGQVEIRRVGAFEDTAL